jgi:hypothetical protein
MYRPRLKICLSGTLQLDHCGRLAAVQPAVRCLKGFQSVDCKRLGYRAMSAVRGWQRWRRSVPRGCPAAENDGIPIA